MAAKRISSLSVTLGATVAPFVNAFAGVRGTINRFVAHIGQAGAALMRFSGIGGAVAGVIGGVLIRQQSALIDANAKLSDRLGITTASLSGLQHAANLSGVSTEQLTAGLEYMLKNVGKAAAGGDALAETFKGLGLDATALAGLESGEAFKAIAQSLKSIQNPAERAAAAVAIFGKSGQTLLPLMLSGADGIAAAVKEAEALGLTFNRVDAAQVEAANDAMTRVQASITGVVRTITIAIAPAIQRAADLFTGWGIRMVTIVKTYMPLVVGAVRAAITWVREIVGTGLAAAWAVASPILARGLEFVRSTFGSIVQAVQSSGVTIGDALRGVGSAVGAVAAAYVAWKAVTWTAVAAQGALTIALGLGKAAYYGVELAAKAVAWAQGAVNTVIAAGAWLQAALTTAWTVGKAAVITFTAAMKTMTIGQIAWKAATVAGTFAQWLLNAALTANPIGIVVVALGALAAWLIYSVDKVAFMRTAMDWMRKASDFASFAFNNFGLVARFVATGAALQIVKLGNQIEHVMTVAAPAWLTWFGNNWRDVFTSVFNFTGTVLKNMGTNILNFFAAVKSWFSGKGFAFKWTGLTEGFVSTMKDLPKIAKRQAGPLEAALQKQVDAMKGQIADGMKNQALPKPEGTAAAGEAAGDEYEKAMKKALADAEAAMKGMKPKGMKPKGMKPKGMKPKGANDVYQPGEFGASDDEPGTAKTGSAASTVPNILAGSAEQMQRMAQAAVTSLPAPQAAAVAKATSDQMRDKPKRDAEKTAPDLLARFDKLIAIMANKGVLTIEETA